ncbi:MAG: 3-oxoacyl-ACP reductase FabG [Lautropia sp.]
MHSRPEDSPSVSAPTRRAPTDAAPAAARRALVTGASGAIGSAIARRLAALGHPVILHAHSHVDRVERLAVELRAGGARVDTIAFDVADEAAAAAACAALDAAGTVQIIINNAGMHDDAVFAGMKSAQWHRVIDVNLHGFFNVCQPLALPMIRRRWGRIISMSSVAGQVGNRGQANYAAAKAGLHGATRSLALELASRGITVNCIAPGIVTSDMSDGAFDQAAIDRIVPMKRAGRPDEVAALAAFLVSDDAAYISGQVIGINGAMV